NYGINISNGEYIARIDADDIAHIDRIQKQFDFLIKNNLDLVGCQMTAIDDNDNILLSSNLPCGLELINKTKFFRSPITHIWLCKKEIYRKLNYYREIPYAEDYDFILRAIDFGYKCDNHPEKLMFIRHRAGNTASTVSLKQRKTHSYVIKLAKEREKIHSLNDSFSSIKLEKHIHYWNVTNLLHNYSSKQLNLAYKENNKFKKIMYIILCISTSIYNFSYLIDKFRYVASYKKTTRKKG
ncbi:glycosyltransferase, partial [Providencia rettgeri]